MYTENMKSVIDGLMERGVKDCLPSGAGPNLFRGKVEMQLQLNMYKRSYGAERMKRETLESEFNKLYKISGARYATVFL